MRQMRIVGQMSLHELKLLLDAVPDTRELILRREPARGAAWNALYDAWSDAHEEAERAWRTWRSGGGHEAYLTYRAAADREAGAQDAVAASPAAWGPAPALRARARSGGGRCGAAP